MWQLLRGLAEDPGNWCSQLTKGAFVVLVLLLGEVGLMGSGCNLVACSCVLFNVNMCV